MQLEPLSQRILGALIEKAMATPQSYPLSVNALRAASNQSTNRDPVTEYTEAQIQAGLKELAGRSLVRAAYARRSSTPRYEHLLAEHLEIGEAAVAVLCVLLLRGPQTLGELRQRTDRLHTFTDLGEVQQTLEALAGHHFGALCVEAPRQPGQKETRWQHLLGVDAPSTSEGGVTVAAEPGLQDEVQALRDRVDALSQQVGELTDEVRRIARFVGA